MPMIEHDIPQKVRESLQAVFARHAPDRGLVISTGPGDRIREERSDHDHCHPQALEPWLAAQDQADEAARWPWALWCIDLHGGETLPTSALARLRDRYADELLLLLHAPDRATLLEAGAEALALGLVGELLLDEPGGGSWALYRHSLHDYKQTPDWLNPRNWANPELWDKYRW
ncbi:MAG: DUF6231 family protein [Halothiobacillaceae bacterium]